MSDVNLISFNGPVNNGQTIDYGSRTFDASAPGMASALKFSTGLSNFVGKFGTAVGGHDACIDVNNLTRNLDITAAELRPTGQFAVTIKGGSENVRVAGNLTAHGKVADVIIGDWSDQSHAMTTGVRLSITPKTGNPVRVLLLKGDSPTLESGTGPYVFLFPWPWLGPVHALIVFGFETLRRWGFFRSQSNNP